MVTKAETVPIEKQCKHVYKKCSRSAQVARCRFSLKVLTAEFVMLAFALMHIGKAVRICNRFSFSLSQYIM